MIRENKNNIIGSEFWLNSEDLSFSEIISISRVPDRWRRFDLIEDTFANYLVKPVNRYVSNLYPGPELISIDSSTGEVVLKQKTHAEIWVKPTEDNLYALDKTWQRQFYPSSNRYDQEGCFKATYKFYIPWLIDANIVADILPCEDTAFYISPQQINFNKIAPETNMVDTQFVDFKIKMSGNHMKDERYGIIDIGTPMYYIKFKATPEQLEKLVNQYGR